MIKGFFGGGTPSPGNFAYAHRQTDKQTDRPHHNALLLSCWGGVKMPT